MNGTDTTIAALSTPPGESGIAVVRMSGPSAPAIAAAVLQFRHGARREGAVAFEHRRTYTGQMVDAGGVAIDDVVVAVMRAPHSYTGEDSIEISCHGGPSVVSAVLDALFEAGARAAEPGEFTRRAFVNGKLDLIQAEAVADLIHSRTELQRRVAHAQLSGGLSARVQVLADQVVEILGIVEANIDFIEDDVDTLDRAWVDERLAEQARVLNEMLSSAAISRPFRDGYRVVVAGPVNAGKSSLFNRLLGETRAIVTDLPGTTRDVIREAIVVDGLVFVLHDTAGLRATGAGPIESIGMDLAAGATRQADVVVFVVDGSQPPDPMARRAPGEDHFRRCILAINKSDLPEHPEWRTPQSLPASENAVRVSAKTGAGVENLKRAIVSAAEGEVVARIARERGIVNERVAGLLRKAMDAAQALRVEFKARDQLEILALETRELLGFYEDAVGRRYRDDVLDVIFSRFCIGK